MRTSLSSPRARKKKPLAKKPWKGARSNPSATRATRTPPLDVSWALAKLKEHYPQAECALVHRSPFELMVATILSAQCTDARVNMVTPALFAKYPSPARMAAAELSDLEEMIRSTGFYKNKALSLKKASQALVEKHNGEVPKTLEELTHLAGVGRKTANVVLGVAYKIPSGFVVDTHVARLSHRFGWTKHAQPEKIEQDLMKLVPQDNWIDCAHLLIHHGRQICSARKPMCVSCFLFDRCPRQGVK